MSRQGGAADPDGLARKLALLLEGAQALGMPVGIGSDGFGKKPVKVGGNVELTTCG